MDGLLYYRTPDEKRNWPLIRELIERCARHYCLLDGQLAQRPYLAGDRFTMANVPAGTTLYRYSGSTWSPRRFPMWKRGTNGWRRAPPTASTSWCRSQSYAAGSNFDASRDVACMERSGMRDGGPGFHPGYELTSAWSDCVAHDTESGCTLGVTN
jgi:hypothetical protein